MRRVIERKGQKINGGRPIVCVPVMAEREEEILRQASRLLDDSAAYERMAQAKNPYGDGQASRRIADCMLAYFQHKSNGEECL